MSYDFTSSDLRLELTPVGEVPHHLDVLPDGREVLVLGDPEGDAKFNHYQGDNPYGYKGTCGLCACQDVLCQFGLDTTESDVVGRAIQLGLCTTKGDEEKRGGTTPKQRVEILKDYGIPAHAETAGTLESLAAHIENGHGVIIAVNAGILWNNWDYYRNGGTNHAVVVTGVAQDPISGDIQGFYVNDSGTGESAKFVDANTIRSAWEDLGGKTVTTDISRYGVTSHR